MGDGIAAWFGLFHFIRPFWLLALLPLAFLWWHVRPKKSDVPSFAEGLAPHLAKALTVGMPDGQRFYPIDGVALTLACLVFAVSGPTWSRAANPLLAQTAPLVVAMKVTPSMETTDIQPSRLKRATFKVLDLVERRAGAQTALVAYAGSAHRVTPLTEDPNILRSYLSGLSPGIMPEEGDRAALALALAKTELARSDTPGAVVFVLDDLNPANLAAFEESAATRPPVIFFVAGGPTIDLPHLNGIPNASVIRMTADDRDLDSIERRVLSAYREALLEDERQDWEDRGWLFAWPALLLFLPWFRRGWTMHWALVVCLMGSLAQPAGAGGWQDWFLTPDQQGQIAFNNNEFSRAADLFTDPAWQAFALLRSGRYEEASAAFAAMETSEAANAEGIALLRSRKYRDGVRAFKKALDRDPENERALHNVEVARAIVEFVETTQAQSDTGEETGIGADDTVFDNESGLGAETEIDRSAEEGPPAGLSTEDWMRSVDTDVGDFLASRFRLEASEGAQ